MAQLQIDPRRPPRLDLTQKRACRWLNSQTYRGTIKISMHEGKRKIQIDGSTSALFGGCTIYYCILGSGWVCRCSHENVASIPGCLGGFDDCKFSIFCNSWLGLVAPFVGCAIYSCVCCFFSIWPHDIGPCSN